MSEKKSMKGYKKCSSCKTRKAPYHFRIQGSVKNLVCRTCLEKIKLQEEIDLIKDKDKQIAKLKQLIIIRDNSLSDANEKIIELRERLKNSMKKPAKVSFVDRKNKKLQELAYNRFYGNALQKRK